MHNYDFPLSGSQHVKFQETNASSEMFLLAFARADTQAHRKSSELRMLLAYCMPQRDWVAVIMSSVAL